MPQSVNPTGNGGSGPEKKGGNLRAGREPDAEAPP